MCTVREAQRCPLSQSCDQKKACDNFLALSEIQNDHCVFAAMNHIY